MLTAAIQISPDVHAGEYPLRFPTDLRIFARHTRLGAFSWGSQDARRKANNVIRLLKICSTSGTNRACVGIPEDKGFAMDRATIEPVIKVLLTEIHAKLNEATRIAKAAEACASAGSISEGVLVSMDIEQLIYDAGRLQNAALLLNQLSSG
jgi:hypothetical protein